VNIVLQLSIGLIVSGAIAWLAFRRRALSRNGALAAIVTGTCIFGLGGWVWGALLIAFFVSSTLLSRFRDQTKRDLAEKFAKGSQRDLWQVLANDGAGSLLALTYSLTGHPILFWAFAGTMATVNADTWATELGVLSRRSPRLITNGRRVERGTSGAISLLGTLATFAGSATVGTVAAIAMALDEIAGGMSFESLDGLHPLMLVLAAVVAGFLGAFTDSLLGATVQVIYFSQKRNKETEKALEADGTPNTRIRGWAWLNNDWVNFLSSVSGAAAGALMWRLLTG